MPAAIFVIPGYNTSATRHASRRRPSRWSAGCPRQQRTQFLKNLAMFGGLLIAGADTAGRPSPAWRTRDAARATQRATRSTRRQAARMARTAKVSGQAGAKAGKLAQRVSG